MPSLALPGHLAPLKGRRLERLSIRIPRATLLGLQQLGADADAAPAIVARTLLIDAVQAAVAGPDA